MEHPRWLLRFLEHISGIVTTQDLPRVNGTMLELYLRPDLESAIFSPVLAAPHPHKPPHLQHLHQQAEAARD
eukprot:1398035-Pyramimonas_sp.AAC.1